MNASVRASVVQYCEAIGKDPLLVQGAGGNVSWKEGATLWVKASGTWLADAAAKDIFVPVDLAHLQQAIGAGDFTVKPVLQGESALRPSIETLLHALMPHQVVVHLHAIGILVYLVRSGFEAQMAVQLNRLGSAVCWTKVDYLKPGAPLAQAIHNALAVMPDADIVFLKNHGVVIGAAGVQEADRLLRAMLGALASSPRQFSGFNPPEMSLTVKGGDLYIPAADRNAHQLAIDETLFKGLESAWALYPDHVVFLGPQAYCYDSVDAFLHDMSQDNIRPELVFIRGIGVFTHGEMNAGKRAQLLCYYEVVTRLPEGCVVDGLHEQQIAELLNWDAEKYRMRIAK